MCSLDELAPRQTHHRGLSMASTSMEMSLNRSSPSTVLHFLLQWCTEPHMNISPTWRVSVVFPRTTSQCRTPHRCLFSSFLQTWPQDTCKAEGPQKSECNSIEQHQTPGMTSIKYSDARQVMVPHHLYKNHGYDIPPLAWSSPSDEYDISVPEAELQFRHWARNAGAQRLDKRKD